MPSKKISLSEAQEEAVKHSGGPLLVNAGPGTGKTLTLVRRIAHLARKKDVEPRSLLAITFTHRAAEEMRERLRRLLKGALSDEIFIGTFHALGFGIVRNEAERLGLKNDPILYDEADQKALLREVLAEVPSDARRPRPEKILSRMEALLRQGLPVEESDDGLDLKTILRSYIEKKREEGAVDFNDLIHLPLKLFREAPERLAYYRNRFRHIFVDEYQDVNTPQVEMIHLLGEGAESLMAIGDPDQSIYSFRGSDVQNFLSFPKTFPGAEMLHLRDNYRSSVTIVSASDQLIRCNSQRLPGVRACAAGGEEGVLLDFNTLATDRGEASFIAQRIAQLTGGVGRYGLEEGATRNGYEDDGEEFSFSEIAVLYRLNAQAKELASALDKAGIPLQRVGTDRAGPEDSERAILALLKLALNPSSRSATRFLETYHSGKEGWTDDLVQCLSKDPSTPSKMIKATRTALAKAVPEKADAIKEAASRLLRRLKKDEPPLESFIASAPLRYREDPFDAKGEKVTLSTMHGAKGLEFPVVFIAGLEEGILPYVRGDEAQTELEEERRLLYVGLTRAQKRIHLTRARKRFLFGKQLSGSPSPFLSEISNDLVRFVREKQFKKRSSKEETNGQMRLF